MQGSARVNQRSNSLEMPCGHQIWQKEPQTIVKCIDGSKVMQGSAEVNQKAIALKCVRPSNVANATKHYAAAGALVCFNNY